jgi:hypothetical protein
MATFEKVNTEGCWQDQLEKVYQQRFPEAFDRTMAEQEKLKQRVDYVEKWINDQETVDLAHKYGIDLSEIWFNNKFAEMPLVLIKVKKHFSDKRLPDGYAYKGGAARALLLRNLGLDVAAEPRDIDVCRLSESEPYSRADHNVALEFMAEDYRNGEGDGVEPIDHPGNYFTSRDFTINEILATDEKIFLTKQALLDTIRNIVRLTARERNFGADHFNMTGDKMIAKAVRLYSEGIHRYGQASIENVDFDYEQHFVNPFWLALHLDRAFEQGSAIAQKYFEELMSKKQIPDICKTPEDAANYLAGKLSNENFYFRHAPINQLKEESDWTS